MNIDMDVQLGAILKVNNLYYKLMGVVNDQRKVPRTKTNSILRFGVLTEIGSMEGLSNNVAVASDEDQFRVPVMRVGFSHITSPFLGKNKLELTTQDDLPALLRPRNSYLSSKLQNNYQ